MSINIKTLHIGSHVQHHGKRKRVHSIAGDTVYLLPSSASSVAHMATTTEIEPIPITPKLLMMLGFVWVGSSACWRREVEENVWLFVNWEADGLWMFSLFSSCEKDVQEPILYAKYLHELEGQLVYYGIELIQD